MVDDSDYTPESSNNIFVPKLGPQVSYRRLFFILIAIVAAIIALSFLLDPDHHKLKPIARAHTDLLHRSYVVRP